ncbi:MAG TPA: ribonuclease D [Vicinamibacteria bacterium]|jgi:ribonuclease D|nr:ribonuclease D [Vicinamibacteria bacterium]
MPQRPPDVVPDIVQRDLTEAQLQAYLASPELSIDTETLGLQQLRDRLCLVQLCDRAGRATIVQIQRDQVIASTAPETRAPRLKRVLEEARVLKVLHFARFDVAVLRHYLGIRLWPLYCTRTASKLVRTYTDRHGLKDVALELLDVEMDKVTRHSDWAAQTLTPEQVRYAISDVTMLIPIMERLDAMVVREGRKELALECFRVIPVMADLDLRGYDLLFEH